MVWSNKCYERKYRRVRELGCLRIVFLMEWYLVKRVRVGECYIGY